MNEFILGQELQDIITGFKGIAAAKIYYLNGCVQYCLKPKIKKSEPDKMTEGVWIDEGQLKLVGAGILKKMKVKKPSSEKKNNPGGDYSLNPKL